MKKLLLLAVVGMLSCSAMAQSTITPEKRQEITTMLQLTGMEKLMDQMKLQMLTSLRGRATDLPEAFWTKMASKMDMHELLEKLIPLYDKYYTLEDLKAVNAFYKSPVGQKVMSTLPKIMQESMLVGREWGEKIGRQVAAEIEQERKAPAAK